MNIIMKWMKFRNIYFIKTCIGKTSKKKKKKSQQSDRDRKSHKSAKKKREKNLYSTERIPAQINTYSKSIKH